MREIKFRAWDKENKLMLCPLSPVWFEENYWHDDDYAKCTECCGLVLMQFTGLKDKNGREIYEGDIVKYKATDNLFPVAFTDGQFLFDEGDQGLTSRRYMTIFPHNLVCEVVGNIYENPDLLKQEV